MKKNSKQVLIGIIGLAAVVFVAVIFLMTKVSINWSENQKLQNESIENMLKNVNVSNAAPQKGSISLAPSALYDELPDINKYPLSVEGKAETVVEIMSSPEKAGEGYESFLIDAANRFNKSGIKCDGKSVAVSVRNVSSGLAADYIISNKFVPDMFSPSSVLWGEYCSANGKKMDKICGSIAGNAAGVLVKKGLGLKSFEDVIQAVQQGKFNMGYTNPQVSTAGMNLLCSILKHYGKDNMMSEKAVDEFRKFQKNIPYVAYNTMQMRDSAGSGRLDGMIMEYQTYINEKDLNETYDFIPYGVLHDNPVYLAKATNRNACKAFVDFCKSSEIQKLASEKGFNKSDYKSDLAVSGSEVTQALQMYKKEKDSGKNIIAVFVADCSGSMDGEPMNQLKKSLANGANYINDNNRIGFVSYSDDVTIELPIKEFDLNQRAYFQGAIDRLRANGSTASYDAVLVAMDMIEKERKNNPDAKVMLFLLSDGAQNVGYSLDNITGTLKRAKIPVYTISYGEEGDEEALASLSSINEAAAIKGDSDDIIYKIKGLFNSQL